MMCYETERDERREITLFCNEEQDRTRRGVFLGLLVSLSLVSLSLVVFSLLFLRGTSFLCTFFLFFSLLSSLAIRIG